MLACLLNKCKRKFWTYQILQKIEKTEVSLIFKKLYFDETKTNHHPDNVLKNLLLQLKWVWEMMRALCADRITFDVLGDFHVHEMVMQQVGWLVEDTRVLFGKQTILLNKCKKWVKKDLINMVKNTWKNTRYLLRVSIELEGLIVKEKLWNTHIFKTSFLERNLYWTV